MVLVQLYFKARPYTIKGLNSILGTRVPFSRRAFGNLFNQTPYFRAMPLLYTLLTGLGRPHRRENDVRKVFTHETGCASRHACAAALHCHAVHGTASVSKPLLLQTGFVWSESTPVRPTLWSETTTALVLDVKTFDVCCATHLQTHHPDQQRLACHRALERHCRANEYKVTNDTPLPPRTRLVVFALSVFGSLGSEAAAFVRGG